MAKNDIINQLANKFSQMGLPYQIGQGTDIAVSTEFLDAQWGSGKKKITYHASIYTDETSQTCFMWEKTTESGSGFSFGTSSESWSQSGKTLFRKVKSVQYDASGKVYEYTLDLGAIPKAVQETANEHGWKFKTVLTQKKALWPEGSLRPQETLQVKEQHPVQSRQEPLRGEAGFCAKCGSSLSPEALFCPSCGAEKQNAERRQQENDYQSRKAYEDKIDYPNSPHQKKGGPGFLFWILGILLLGFDILMFLGGSGPLFLMLALLVLIGFYLIRNRLSTSVIKMIGAFIAVVIITFILFALTVSDQGKKSRPAVIVPPKKAQGFYGGKEAVWGITERSYT